MKRVLVGGFHHESNSLSKIISRKQDFRVIRGSEITDHIVPNSSLSGIVTTLRSAGIEVVPTLHMRGVPNGEIDRAFFEKIMQEFLDMARREKGRIDAVTLALHGSMRVDGVGEAEGLILKELRAIYPDTPIFVALDMHASISADMCAYSDGMVGYKTAPHIDCTETGVLAAEMTLFALEQRRLPKTATIKIPMIIAGEKSGTDVEPMTSLIRLLREVEQNDEVLAASYLLGFPWSDNPDNAVSVHVVTKHDQDAADRIAKELAHAFWAKRDAFVFVTEAYDCETSIRKALEYINGGHTPVYLSDSGDNPTAGGASDNTEFLHSLLSSPEITRSERLKSNPVIYAGFYDPDSLHRCRGNVGKELQLEMGGKFDTDFPPAPVRGTVTSYVEGFVYAGIPGDVAVLSADGIDLILAENHIGFTDPSLMTALGLDPQGADIIVCKLGYLTPGHSAIAKKSVLVLSRGATNEDIESIPYERIRRPMYPMDRQIDYRPELCLPDRSKSPDSCSLSAHGNRGGEHDGECGKTRAGSEKRGGGRAKNV